MCPNPNPTRRPTNRPSHDIPGRTPAVVVRRRPGWWRAITALAIAIGLLVVPARLAAAQPVDPATVPESLRQYVPGSAEWLNSPWMTSPGCRDHGGDWSVYVTSIIADLPELLGFFQPQFAGTDAEAAARKEALLKGFRELPGTITVPAGYCVDAVKTWATPNGQFQPFGFEWGNAQFSEHGVGLRPGCGQVRPDDLAPCRGFYLSCDGAATQQDEQACQAWNAFSDDYVKRVHALTTQAYTAHPVTLRCDRDCGPLPDVVMDIIEAPADLVADFVNWVAKKGMEQVVAFIVSGVIGLWAVFTRIAIDYSSPNLTGNSFASVYNLVAGIALALAFLGWLVTLASSWKRGQLQYSLLGGIKAVVGATLAAVGAILMVRLADDCTTSLISAAGGLARQADFSTSLLKANPLVAILAGVLIAISLIFATIFLVISGPLVMMWALFGAIAAAGQVHEASAGWLFTWGSRLTALAWAKFFMIAVMLLAQALLLPLDAGEDPVKQVVDVIQGLALCLLIVLCPWLLWELVDFVGHRAGAGASVGGVASRLGGSGVKRAPGVAGAVGRTAGRVAGATAGAAGSAIGAMIAGAAHVARRFPGGATTTPGSSGGGGYPGAANLPRPETTAGPVGGPAPGGVGSPTPSGPGGDSHGGGNSGVPPLPRPPANRGQVVAGPRSVPSPSGASGPGAQPTGGSTAVPPESPPRMPPPA
jgi:hypothetical protein